MAHADVVNARERFWVVMSAIWWIAVWLIGAGIFAASFLRFAVVYDAWYLVGMIASVVLGGDQIVKHSKPLLPRFTDAAGDARWGTLKDLKKADLLNSASNGVYCGRFGGENGKPVYYSGDRHIITVGMTGTGKDTRFLTPNLKHLDNRSAIVLDPKGEQAAITASYRSKCGPVFAFDPTGLLERLGHPLKSSGFNVLKNLRADDPLFYDKGMEIAESLINRASITEAHWPEGAEAILTALTLRAKLGETKGEYQASLGLVNEMLSESYDENDTGGLRLILREIASHSYRPMAKLAGRFLGYSKENKSFISVALNNLKSLNSPAIAADLEGHPIMPDGPFKGKPFDFEMMKHQVITVYVILPDDMFETHAVWLRLIIANALNALKRTGPGPISPVLMLNEIGNLGYLKPLANAMGMVRGKGIAVWLLLQSLQQLTDIYGKAGAATFKGNAGVISALRVNDLETADELSKRSGNRTVVETSYNSEPDNTSKSETKSSSGYGLMQPGGFASLPDGETVCWIDSMPYRLTVPFYNPRGLDPNPYRRR